MLVGGGAEHAQEGVPTAGLYQASIHSKYRAAQLLRCLPGGLVEKLALHGGPERLDHRVVHRGGNPAHRPRTVTGICSTGRTVTSVSRVERDPRERAALHLWAGAGVHRLRFLHRGVTQCGG